MDPSGVPSFLTSLVASGGIPLLRGGSLVCMLAAFWCGVRMRNPTLAALLLLTAAGLLYGGIPIISWFNGGSVHGHP